MSLRNRYSSWFKYKHTHSEDLKFGLIGMQDCIACMDLINKFNLYKDNKEIVECVLFCPNCDGQHIDFDEWRRESHVHKSHLCQFCGEIWKPFKFNTIGSPTPPGFVFPVFMYKSSGFIIKDKEYMNYVESLKDIWLPILIKQEK